MINTLDIRKKDIKRVIKSLDITPTMFKNAEEKYKNISAFLNKNGLDVDISLQGSFAIGTAIKPYSQGRDKSYDVDVICVYDDKTIQSQEARERLLLVLNDSEVYSDKITEWPKCFTLDYAKIGDYDFSIDLVPTRRKEGNIPKASANSFYLTDILEIAIKEKKYDWYTINPKGYQKWFCDINSKFALYNRELRMNQVFEDNKHIFAKVEDIPEYFNKSALQEAIQILKRSRDVYFSKIRDDDNKPASIIITTFAALTAKKCPANIDSVDLAMCIINDLRLYSRKEMHSEIDSPIIKYNGKWEFLNPVNSEDNLLDSWNKNEFVPKKFFEWVEKARQDLNEIISKDGINHVDILGNSFGNEVVNKLFGREKVEEINHGVKPYHD